jgi:predicted nucleic acid-binding protein
VAVTLAVDSNILFDILTAGSSHFDDSVQLIERVADVGLVISDVVYAEVGTIAPSKNDLDRLLEDLGIAVRRPSSDALYAASVAWRAYTRRRPEYLACPNCGTEQRLSCTKCQSPLRQRQRILADFIVGAHALIDEDGLLTRDQRYFQTYFPKLRLL